MPPITNMTSPDMIEATRLTREGRLAEATALLQGRFHGQEMAGTTVRESGAASTARPLPRLLEVDPETGAVTDADASFPGPQLRRPGSRDWSAGDMPQPSMPLALQSLLGKLKRGDLAGQSPAHAPAPVPDGAQFVAATFSSAPGTLPYKLFIPSRYRGKPAPLIVMLHGCTQSPDDFAAGTRMNDLAEQQIFLVAYPAQPASANAQKCWNWFNPGDQGRDRGEPALIAGITRQVMRDHAVDPARVYVAGLSAGGAAAAIMGAAYPDLYAAVGVHSGLACGAARDLPSAFAAMRQGGAPAPHRSAGRPVPTIVFHADRDTTVHPANADQVTAQATASARTTLQSIIERGQVPGGRAYTRTRYAGAADGHPVHEQWVVHGGGHAWSGGSPNGSYTDPTGPDASQEMLRFFLEHPHAAHRH